MNEQAQKPRILSVLIAEEQSAIESVMSAIRRQGVGVVSWTVAQIERPGYLRFIVETDGDLHAAGACLEALESLSQVLEVDLMDSGAFVGVQVALVRVQAEGENQDRAGAIIGVRGGRLLSLDPTSFTAEVSGKAEKIDRMIEELREVAQVEIVRSRLLAIRK